MPADSYALGVDLGTTFSAAAVARDGQVSVVSLGTVAQAVPSIVAVRVDGRVLVGEAAEMAALAEPDRSARQFKRRIGDDVPLVLGGVPYGAETLTGYLLRAIVDQVAEREGGRPSKVVLTHPANWSPFKLAVLDEAANVANVSRAELLPEPLAAAVAYESRSRVAPGELLAVYDLGGGTFDVAVVRRSEQSFDLIGRPAGLDRLGGIDFDQAVFAHVDTALDGAATRAASEPNAHRALSRLRADCSAAKHHLSSSPDVSIPVLLPNVQTEVRLTRDEFEAMIRPRITQTIEVLERTVTEAGLTMAEVASVLLVGGSSHIPLIADAIREQTGRPVALDAHPKLTIATGAALWAETRGQVAAIAEATVAEVAPTAETPVPGATAHLVGPKTEAKGHRVRRRMRGRSRAKETAAGALAAAVATTTTVATDDKEPTSPATIGAIRPTDDAGAAAAVAVAAGGGDPTSTIEPTLELDELEEPTDEAAGTRTRQRIAIYGVAGAILLALVVGVVLATTGGGTAHTSAAAERKHRGSSASRSSSSTTTSDTSTSTTTATVGATTGPIQTGATNHQTGQPGQTGAPLPPAAVKPGPPPCQTSQLTGNVGSPSGTATTLVYTLTVMNASQVTCTVSGYPGVALFDANGQQIGPAASKEPGHPIPVVTLAPTQIAFTRLTSTVPSGASCPPASTTIHLYPPGQVTPLSFAGVIQACNAGLTVTPMAPGAG